MKKVFISKNYRDKYTASSKAKYDCEKILEGQKYENIGLPRAYMTNKYIGQLYTILSNLLAYLCMPSHGIVLLQYPVAMFSWQIKRAKQKKNKVIVIIHDLNALRGLCNDEIRNIEQTDVVIVHTEAMKRWFEENTKCKNIVVLEIFDYLLDENAEGEINNYFSETYKSICFAGNLGKSPFLDKLQFENVIVNLFGIGMNDRILQDCCVYKGCYAPNELSHHLKSMFGLVWDGDSIETCSGVGGEYLRLISPHKLSMYLSSGLPVIVWKESAMADFVVKNGVGYAINTLGDIDCIVAKLDNNTYKDLLHNVRQVRDKIVRGDYLSLAICKFENKLL